MTAVARPECIGEYGCVGEIVLVERPPGARSFAAPTAAPVTKSPMDGVRRVPNGVGPALAYGASGGAVLVWTADEYVCSECDMDTPTGPLVVWGPGRPRTTLSTKPALTALAPLGDGVAIALEADAGQGGDADPVPADRAVWLSTAGTEPRRLGTPPLSLWEEYPLFTGGGRRLLQATGHGGVRASLGDIGP